MCISCNWAAIKKKKEHSDPNQTTSGREVSIAAVIFCFGVSTLSQHWALCRHLRNPTTFPLLDNCEKRDTAIQDIEDGTYYGVKQLRFA